jgi:hypothetical protein
MRIEQTVLALQKDIGCFRNIRCLKILVGGALLVPLAFYRSRGFTVGFVLTDGIYHG